MKKRILSLFLAACGLSATAQKSSWSLDPVHSNVKFTVVHMMVSEMDGSFKVYDGKVESSSDDFNNASIDFSVDVNSIDTDNDMRDKHLKADDFFNAEKYPKMTFKSTSFKKVSDKKYELTGDLTIRDVTKKVTFDVAYNGTQKDPYGNIKAGFKAKGTINRKEFKLMWGPVTETGGVVVSDEVDITINAAFAKNK